MKQLTCVVLILAAILTSECQPSNTFGLEKSQETIVKFSGPGGVNVNDLFFAGYSDGTLFFSHRDNDSVRIYSMSERDLTWNSISKTFARRGAWSINYDGRCVFFSEARRTANAEELNIYIKVSGVTHLVGNLSNADKRIVSNFSGDHSKILFSSLSVSRDFYEPSKDDFINIADISNSEVPPKITRVGCNYCSSPFLIKDTIFFTKAEPREEFNFDFGYTNIFKSRLSAFADSVKIASYTNILAISDDGTFLVGVRFTDLPNRQLVIIDAINQRYQLLLGRDYGKGVVFYSSQKKKFAILTKGTIIYLEKPRSFPFNSLQKERQRIPEFREKDFYEQFRHADIK
jgi:hypothetical protein